MYAMRLPSNDQLFTHASSSFQLFLIVRIIKEIEMEEPTAEYPYGNYINVRFSSLERIGIQQLADDCSDSWYNQTLCSVNDSVVRLGVMEGEYHWHHHDDEDEFSYVVQGRFIIDLEDRSVELGPRQGLVSGARHRPGTRLTGIHLSG